MRKVLMVCLGNICRSPLAHGVLEHMVDPAQIQVDSAGTGAYHIGKAPDRRSIHIAGIHSLDISQQRARQFCREDFKVFDHILVMDRDNLRDVLALAPDRESEEKVSLLLSHTNSPIDEVPDPYYGGEEGFEYVYYLIHQACKELVIKLNTQWN